MPYVSQLPSGMDHLVNYGVLGIIVMFVLVALWKIGSRGGSKAMELGERYVSSTEKLHDTLKEADRRQHELCVTHAIAMESITASMERQNETLSKSCGHLEALEKAHGPDWHKTMEAIHENNMELKRAKKAAMQACEMCRHLADAEFPTSAQKIGECCDEIERIINEV